MDLLCRNHTSILEDECPEQGLAVCREMENPMLIKKPVLYIHNFPAHTRVAFLVCTLLWFVKLIVSKCQPPTLQRQMALGQYYHKANLLRVEVWRGGG